MSHGVRFVKIVDMLVTGVLQIAPVVKLSFHFLDHVSK